MTKNIDWGNLGFEYTAADYRVTATYKDGKWSELKLTDDPTVHISECAGVLQYARADAFFHINAVISTAFSTGSVS